MYDIDFKGANSYTKWARLEQKNQLFCSHFGINQAIFLKFSGFVHHMSVLDMKILAIAQSASQLQPILTETLMPSG